MSHRFISRTCAFCRTPFEYPITSPRRICVPCASNHSILEEHVRQQEDFKLRIGLQVFEPIYWAIYDVQSVGCYDLVIYQYKGIMRVGRVGSIHLKQGTLFVRPTPSSNGDPREFVSVSHEIAWESILCVLRPLCS